MLRRSRTNAFLWLGIAGKVWDSTFVLLEYLNTHRDIVENRVVVELGSGTGLAGKSKLFIIIMNYNYEPRLYFLLLSYQEWRLALCPPRKSSSQI